MKIHSFTLFAFLSLTNGQFIEEVSIVSKTKASPVPAYNHQSAPSSIYHHQSRSPGHLGRLASRKSSIKDPLLETCFNRTESDQYEGSSGSQGSKEYSRTLIRGSHAFSLALTKFLVNFESKDTSKGILVSPFSVWSSLIVMFMGAKGRTEIEIKNALDIESIPKESVAMAYQGLRLWYKVKANSNGSNNGNLNLRRNSDNVNTNKFAEFSVANRVFINSNLKLSKCIQNNFLTEVQSVDFADSGRTLKSINAWISRMTHGRIVDLISADSINAFTQLLIANAVYFKSPWEFKFDPSLSFTGPFVVSPTETMNVTFMKQTSNFMFANNEDLSVSIIDLPYIGSAYSMLIILPDTTRGIDNLVSTIKPDDIYNLVTSMYSDEIEVTLPKFKLEQEFDLAGPLYSLGIKSLFDPRIADLSGFLDESENTPNGTSTADMLSVNNVVHKASIAVDEEGSEAVAATAFVLSRSGRPLFPTKFTADRPFMYLIRDTATNVILFSGIVRRPTYE